jgi:hypothetical protein
MAVSTKAAKKAKVDPDVETKEEEEVIVDQRLSKLLRDYNNSEKQTHGYWLKIVQYVKAEETSREVLKATLIDVRKVTEGTANVEATMILNAAKEEHSDLLQQALDGDITTREFRKAIMNRREDTGEGENQEKKLELKLKACARFAIEKVEMDDAKEFRKLAFEVFTDVREKYEEEQEQEETEAKDEDEDQLAAVAEEDEDEESEDKD